MKEYSTKDIRNVVLIGSAKSGRPHYLKPCSSRAR